MTPFHHRPLFCAALLAATAFLPAACTSATNEFREVSAERIARPAFMIERRLEVANMSFQLWERMHEPHAPVHVYIEGDGRTLGPLGSERVSIDPTPDNPVALHLASRDLAPNIAYISRPCMFMESPDRKVCDPAYWSTRRFSPEVMAAYNEALDEIKQRYSLTEIHLVGYDGGANIVAALATMREDIATIRTVAGILNPNMVYTEIRKSPLAPDTISAMDLAPQLSGVPQHHFIGAGDERTPPAVYHSFAQAMGPSECVHYTLIPDADHTRGWVEKWPDLLGSTTACAPKYEPVPLPPRPVDKDGMPNK